MASVIGNVSRTNDRRGFVVGDAAYVSDLPRTLAPEPAVLYYLLRFVLGFRDLGPTEKTAWECVFECDGVRASVAHRKLGVYLYIDKAGVADRTEARVLATQIRMALRRALEVVNTEYLNAFAEAQLREGNVTVLNQHARLREMVDYFRDRAMAAYAGEGHVGPARRLFTRETEGFFNTVAMASAYYSWLEHLLVLALPFVTSESAEPLDVRAFMKKRWHQKFAVVLDVGSDRLAARYLDRLRDNADRYRNPYLHGSVDTHSEAVGFHLPGCGAVSMNLGERGWTPGLLLYPFDERGFSHAAKLFDATDRFLRRHRRTRYPMRWAEAGQDVAFDPGSRAEYKEACRSDEDFDRYVEASALAWERDVNMDW